MSVLGAPPSSRRTLDLERWCIAAYPRLVAAARCMLRGRRPAAGVDAADVVHELYLRLERQRDRLPADERLVTAFARRVMRQVLIDQGRRSALRRADRLEPDGPAAQEADPLERLALAEALGALQGLRPEQHRLLRLRYFRGLTLEECAERMGLSLATLKRETARAHAWLMRRL